ncbi:MAG TPA: hybrid sensor histidine kinase/response regulator [Xanthobacteraceae bacterium]|nr:hybrid sensor histidine kinase/response regulator [Xanthobacteraceae bacterium]
MDDLLREFLTETSESLDVVDVELVRFEREPNNAEILGNVFRLVHTIKGTCGFLALPRLEALAHAAETLMGRFRDGLPVTSEAVTVVLASIDRIKEILAALETDQAEPEGGDEDLIKELVRLSAIAPVEQTQTVGTLVHQVLERPLRPGEVSLDDLERAFRETRGPAMSPPPLAEADSERRSDADRRAAIRREEEQREAAAKAQTLRVQVETLERLMTMVSEQVLTRNQLLEIVRRSQESEFKAPLQRLSNVTAELQEGVIKTRMQPIGNAWSKLPRIVRDLANELGKEIDLEMHGAETELDRQVLEVIKDPLTHMVRNSADHGIEMPKERRAAGKPEKGTLRLSARHEGGHIIIAIADDGRGLNVERIRAKAVRMGLISATDKLTDAQIQKFIFAPGFSTAAAVTNVSGRGVGMDVVKTNIHQIGGSIGLKSVQGRGTTFTIKIPLTLAIVPALIVEAAKERFAIPQVSVLELVRVRANSEHRIERVKDAPVLRLRNKLLPLVHLGSLLQLSSGEAEDGAFIVVMQTGNRTMGVVVDGVFHTEEIVVKPMASKLRDIAMFSGNTILGDGAVILILDPNGIAGMLGGRLDSSEVVEQEQRDKVRVEETDRPISLLVFRAGGDKPKAVPLSLITRLEEIDAKEIQQSSGRALVQYRGTLMPLVLVNDGMRIRTEGMQPLLVFIDAGRSMGIAVDEIVDIVEERLNIEVGSATPGILGSAIVKGKATEIIDVAHFLPLAHEDWFQRKEMNAEARKRRLLFVDDSVFFRDMLTPVLKAAGYDVTTAADGREALALVEKGDGFDVIVSDIEMPEIGGFELAEALRADKRMGHVPIIALTSHTSPAMLERGIRAGFRAFVAKFDRQGLIAALKDTPFEISKAA